MKHHRIFLFVLIALVACKKETTLPTLSFSAEERKWFIYGVGQTITLKNAAGDSVTYSVTGVRNEFKPEYKDPFNNPVQIASTEFYQVDLKGTTDSIFIYFYKEFQYTSDPNKMQQTIGWNTVIGQFVELAAIKSQFPFITKSINGITFNKVTAANPLNQTLYPWTKWIGANYDQDKGFVELVDTGGVSWYRR